MRLPHTKNIGLGVKRDFDIPIIIGNKNIIIKSTDSLTNVEKVYIMNRVMREI